MTAKMFFTHSLLLPLFLVLGLSGCGGKSPSSRFYVLSPLPGSGHIGREEAAIGVLPVSMPDYLDRPQIVTRPSENEVQIDEFNRWAEPLKESFTMILVENLCRLLGSEKVVRTAMNARLPVDLQIMTEVLRLDGTLGGDVVLDARWGLVKTETKGVLLVRKATIREPTGAATYEALVAAESRALGSLSRQIAESILGKR